MPCFRTTLLLRTLPCIRSQTHRHPLTQVRFNACQALHELQRLGLVVRVEGPEGEEEEEEGEDSSSYTDDSDGCDVGALSSSDDGDNRNEGAGADGGSRHGARSEARQGAPVAAAGTGAGRLHVDAAMGSSDWRGVRMGDASWAGPLGEAAGCGCDPAAEGRPAAAGVGLPSRELPSREGEEARGGGRAWAAAGRGGGAAAGGAAEGWLPVDGTAAGPFSIRISVDMDGRDRGAGAGPTSSQRRSSGAARSGNFSTGTIDTTGGGALAGWAGAEASQLALGDGPLAALIAGATTVPAPGPWSPSRVATLGMFAALDDDGDVSDNAGAAAAAAAGGCRPCRCEDPLLGCTGAEGCGCADVWWAAVPLRDAVPVVEDHWAGLLWRRVKAILRRRDGL